MEFDFEEELEFLICNNLELLGIIDPERSKDEVIFEKSKILGFETIGHHLLMLVDPEECKKSIPWPLLDDKRLQSEFRTKFIKFIKMINVKYPEARIPNMTASMIHFPGGRNFMKFIHMLSSFVLKLKLEKIINKEIKEDILPKFVPSRLRKDNLVKINIIKGAQYEVGTELLEFERYASDAQPVIQELHEYRCRLNSDVQDDKAQLEAEVSSLPVDEKNKLLLLSIEDHEAIKVWNQTTNKKIKDLTACSERVQKIKEQSAQVCQQLREMVDSPLQQLCLDGDKLHMSSLEKCTVIDRFEHKKRKVKLEEILRSGIEVAEQLQPRAPPQVPLLPQSQILLKGILALQNRVTEKSCWLDNVCSECKKIISELQPIVNSRMMENVGPKHLQYLRRRPVLQFTKINEVSNTTSSLFDRDMTEKIVNQVKSLIMEGKLSKIKPWKKRRSNSFESILSPSTKSFRQSSIYTTTPASKVCGVLTPYSTVKLKRLPIIMKSVTKEKRTEKKKNLRRSNSLTSLKTAVASYLDSEECPPPTDDLSPVSVLGKSLHVSPSCWTSEYIDEPLVCLEEELVTNSPSLQSLKSQTQDPHDVSDLIQLETPKPKFKRQSLNNLVDRFMKIKQSMAVNSQTSN